MASLSREMEGAAAQEFVHTSGSGVMRCWCGKKSGCWGNESTRSV